MVLDEKRYILIIDCIMESASHSHTHPQLVSSVLVPVLANNKQRDRKRVSSSTAGSSFLASEQPNYQGTSFFPVIRMAPPLERGTRARTQAYTHRTPVRLHAERFSKLTHRTSDSPQLLARHHFEEVSLSFTSYFPLMCLLASNSSSPLLSC
ncbi:hypothetical protein ILYODFUR_036386 [Ilyodon furcidens]|uniref:Uncharacterized protein n=1 Tax=Ilyodon furcidens TaxID=33524 RepID=A0ABV0T355_9TELE